MKNNIKKVFNNWKKIFCFSMLFLSFLLAFVILIKKPMKVSAMDMYDSSQEVVTKKITFPIEQDIHVDVDNISAITIYPGETNLNDFQYQIELTDEDGDSYFSHDYQDYKGNFMYLFFGKIPNSKGKTLHLKITCEDGQEQDVFMDVARSQKNGTNIINDSDNTLKITMNYYTRNYGYFWYSMLGIAIALILFPLAKEETIHEK